MKQFSILLLLTSFILSTGIWSFADFKTQDSNLETVKSKKKKGKTSVKPAPKKVKEKKVEEKAEEDDEEGTKGFGGNKYKFDKNKDDSKK
jgi:cytoskeletal protein RodZ